VRPISPDPLCPSTSDGVGCRQDVIPEIVDKVIHLQSHHYL